MIEDNPSPTVMEFRQLIRGEVVDFKMWAERPNKLRIESTTPKRK